MEGNDIAPPLQAFEPPPSRKPRFGNPQGHASQATLPTLDGLDLAEPTRPLFQLTRELDGLGLAVAVIERPKQSAPSELWATAISLDQTHLGKEVVIGLIGAANQIHRVTVTLGESQDGGCSGESRIGTIRDIRTELGSIITLSAFLYE